MVITTPRSVTTIHKQTTTQATAVNIDPQGKTQHRTHSYPICSGTGDSIRNMCARYGIQTHFKANKTFRQVLVKSKDQDSKEEKSGVIYSYQCGAFNCGEEYIGETSRTLGEHCREHLKDPSYIHVHSLHTDHQLSPDQFNIIGRGPGPIQVDQRVHLH